VDTPPPRKHANLLAACQIVQRSAAGGDILRRSSAAIVKVDRQDEAVDFSGAVEHAVCQNTEIPAPAL
jgi:hypothetical protein